MPLKLNARQQELWLQREKVLQHISNILIGMPKPRYEQKINEDNFLLEIEELCTCTEAKAWQYFNFFLRQGYFIRDKEHFKVVYEAIAENKYGVEFPKPSVAGQDTEIHLEGIGRIE